MLPPDMIVLAEPVPENMVEAIGRAIKILPSIDPFSMHNRMRTLYSWTDVAKRTEVVYDHAINARDEDLLQRLSKYFECGPWAGKLFCLVVIFDFIIWNILEWWKPSKEVDIAPDVVHPKEMEQQ